ncbi:hypothetical protein JCM33374_g2250 [Metschnikowia sp. JCM 33374]|nr:hypothetical protein JCM33374_g2250 [Metschnikowia sp. JCM 33374]
MSKLTKLTKYRQYIGADDDGLRIHCDTGPSDISTYGGMTPKCFVNESSKKTADHLYTDAEIAHQAIDALIRNWKGHTSEGIRFVVAAVEKYNTEYSSRVKLYHPAANLAKLLSGFPPAGNYMVKDWLARNKLGASNDNISTLKKFVLELWPRLLQGETTRAKPDDTVTHEVKLKMCEMLEGANCQHDFWEATAQWETKGIKAVSTKHAKWGKSRTSQYSRNEATLTHHLVLKLRKLSKENPELCPNCFKPHHIKACDQMAPDPMDNVAAYFLSEYEQKTGKSRATSQRQFNQIMDTKKIDGRRGASDGRQLCLLAREARKNTLCVSSAKGVDGPKQNMEV